MASIKGITYTGDNQQFMDALLAEIEQLRRQITLLERGN